MFSRTKKVEKQRLSLKLRQEKMIPFLKKGVEIIWQSKFSKTKSCDVPRKLNGQILLVNKLKSLF